MIGESENSGQKENVKWRGGNVHVLKGNGTEIKCGKDPDHAPETGGVRSMPSPKKRKTRRRRKCRKNPQQNSWMTYSTKPKLPHVYIGYP